MTKHKHNGFTLIELIVIVTIISIMTSLLMSALALSQRRSEGIQCSNRLKDLGSAFYAHAGDYGYFPAPNNDEVDLGGYKRGTLWLNAIASYMGYSHVCLGENIQEGDFDDNNELTCPTAFKLDDNGFYEEQEIKLEKKINVFGYSMNNDMWTGRKMVKQLTGGKNSRSDGKTFPGSAGRNNYKVRPVGIKYPQSLFMVTDSVDLVSIGFDISRHYGNGIALFADGHVINRTFEYWKQKKTDYGGRLSHDTEKVFE